MSNTAYDSDPPSRGGIDSAPPCRPLTVRIADACRLTGIGRSKLYLLINEGHIEVRKVGSMTLIPFHSIETFLDVRASR